MIKRCNSGQFDLRHFESKPTDRRRVLKRSDVGWVLCGPSILHLAEVGTSTGLIWWTRQVIMRVETTRNTCFNSYTLYSITVLQYYSITEDKDVQYACTPHLIAWLGLSCDGRRDTSWSLFPPYPLTILSFYRLLLFAPLLEYKSYFFLSRETSFQARWLGNLSG